MTQKRKREGKNALISLVVAFILIMTLAGGCVPTAMARSPLLPSQPAATALHGPQDLESLLAAWTGEHRVLARMAGEAATGARSGHADEARTVKGSAHA